MIDLKLHHRGYFRRTICLLGLSIVVAAVGLGCDSGPRLIKVKGTVNVDGNPAEGVGLIFFDQVTSQVVASAKSGANGSFSAMTDMKPGIPVGNYIVTAQWPDPSYVPPKTQMGAEPPAAPDLLKDRYARVNSKLTVEITSSTSEVPIDLTTK